MWKLSVTNPNVVDEHANSLVTSLANRIINSSVLGDKDKSLLLPGYVNGTTKDNADKSVIRELLTLPPVELYSLNNKLMQQLISGYDESELPEYSSLKLKKSPDIHGKKLLNKYSKIGTLFEIFDYKGQISQNKKRSYRITKSLNINTCTYCNRQYTFTVIKQDTPSGKKNDRARLLTRPALDHWFPESLFPLMSLSFYNLIPCCTICNSSLKGDKIFNFSTHIHPYIQKDDDPGFKFVYTASHISGRKYDVDLVGFRSIKEKNMVDDFSLRDMYNCHANLEVLELITLAQKNNGLYLKQLFQDLHLDGYSKNDAYRILLNTEFDAKDFKNRPLSKLKRDILRQIDDNIYRAKKL